MTVGATLFLWDRAGVIALSQTIDAQTGANLTAMAEAAGDEAGDLAADQGVVTFAAACMSIFTVVYIVVLAVMFKRILIAVKVVREACKALAAMPLLVAQPLCTRHWRIPRRWHRQLLNERCEGGKSIGRCHLCTVRGTRSLARGRACAHPRLLVTIPCQQ